MVKLVLIDPKLKLVSLYHNKAHKASFEIPKEGFSKEDIEYIRTLDIKELA